MRTFIKQVPCRYIEIDGEEFPFSVFREVLENLAGCDGSVERLVIYNQAIAKFLEKKGVARPNIRGSYGQGKNYETFLAKFEEECSEY